MSQATRTTFRTAGKSLAKLLGQHYGDRSVYLQHSSDRALLEDALSLGLVSAEGQLTTAGYMYWQRHQQD